MSLIRGGESLDQQVFKRGQILPGQCYMHFLRTGIFHRQAVVGNADADGFHTAPFLAEGEIDGNHVKQRCAANGERFGRTLLARDCPKAVVLNGSFRYGIG